MVKRLLDNLFPDSIGRRTLDDIIPSKGTLTPGGSGGENALSALAGTKLPTTTNTNILKRRIPPRISKLVPPTPPPKKVNLISADALANKIGFKNQDEFFKYIDEFGKGTTKTTTAEATSLKKLFILMRKNPKVVAIVGMAATAGVLVDYAKRHQSINSGCFRYIRKEGGTGYREKSRKKISGYSCSSENSKAGAEIIANKHPLYKVAEKWDCNFKGFNQQGRGEEENEILVKEILDLGCGGLCSVENFNKLAAITDGFNPLDEWKNKDRYIYRCEKVTILNLLMDHTGDAIDQMLQGALDSDLGRRFKSLFDFSNLKIYIFIFIVLFFYYQFICKKDPPPPPPSPYQKI